MSKSNSGNHEQKNASEEAGSVSFSNFKSERFGRTNKASHIR